MFLPISLEKQQRVDTTIAYDMETLVDKTAFETSSVRSCVYYPEAPLPNRLHFVQRSTVPMGNTSHFTKERDRVRGLRIAAAVIRRLPISVE